jgi:hypothetical protein
METSILTSTKKVLGIEDDYTAFDLDITIHINTALSTLSQLGIGPIAGLSIEDKTTNWSDFITDDDPFYNSVKTYVYLRVRQVFDPPATSYLIAAFDQQIKELEWRLNVIREGTDWVEPPDPTPPPPPWWAWWDGVING